MSLFLLRLTSIGSSSSNGVSLQREGGGGEAAIVCLQQKPHIMIPGSVNDESLTQVIFT